jgi:hypothetical protein
MFIYFLFFLAFMSLPSKIKYFGTKNNVKDYSPLHITKEKILSENKSISEVNFIKEVI